MKTKLTYPVVGDDTQLLHPVAALHVKFSSSPRGRPIGNYNSPLLMTGQRAQQPGFQRHE